MKYSKPYMTIPEIAKESGIPRERLYEAANSWRRDLFVVKGGNGKNGKRGRSYLFDTAKFDIEVQKGLFRQEV